MFHYTAESLTCQQVLLLIHNVVEYSESITYSQQILLLVLRVSRVHGLASLELQRDRSYREVRHRLSES